MNPDLRKVTYDIISEFEKNKSQLKLTRDRIINKADISSNDKSRITVFTNEVVKWKKKIDYYISINLKKLSLEQPIRLIISEFILNFPLFVFSIILRKNFSNISTLT